MADQQQNETGMTCPCCGRKADTLYFDIHPDVDGRCRLCVQEGRTVNWPRVLTLSAICLVLTLTLLFAY